MSSKNPEILKFRKKTGDVLTVIVPTCVADIENQIDVPAYALAIIAFSKKINNTRVYSRYTCIVMKKLAEDYGDDNIRLALIGLFEDMALGFKPVNPIGILIHRVKMSATSDTFDI